MGHNFTYHHQKHCVHREPASVNSKAVEQLIHKGRLERRAGKLSKLSYSGGELSNVATEVALGNKFSADAKSRIAAEHRIGKATGTFHAYWPVFGHADIDPERKLIVYRAVVTVTLAHGSEAWDLRDASTELNKFNHQCLSQIISGKSYEEIAKDLPVDIITLIMRRRLRFLGHLLRGPPTQQCLRILLTCLKAKPGSVRDRKPWGDASRVNHADGEPPSVRHPYETDIANSPEYTCLFGKNPQDLDFDLDRGCEEFQQSIFSLAPFNTFAEIFDVAQDKERWLELVARTGRQRSKAKKK